MSKNELKDKKESCTFETMIPRTFFFLLLSISALTALEKDNRVYIHGYDNRVLSKTVPKLPKPWMWTARLKVDRSLSVGLERELIHNSYGAIFMGANLSYFETLYSIPDEMTAVSVYLLSRLYIIKRKGVELFVLYSPAGPTMLSQKVFSTTQWSLPFVFQNQIGFGLYLKNYADLECTIKQCHYSNGDLFPKNGGVDIPLSVGLSFRF
jgi:hypothetical protein